MSIGATFWSFSAMQQFVAAVPYTQNGSATGPYIWSNQGQGNQFARPPGAPGCRVGAVVAQFLMLGDLYQTQQQTLFISNGSQTSYSGTLNTPMAGTGFVADQQGVFLGTFVNGQVGGINLADYGLFGTVNYSTGALSFNIAPTPPGAPPAGDLFYASYTQVAPYRVQWSAIGSPTNWPIPLTNAALAVQSGFNDLQTDLGPVMFIAGYPLYGLVFQRYGITRASYIGGQVVFSWQPYEFKRGCIAHGAAVKVGPIVYFLADSGFYLTDGANVVPIGTAQDNSAGIDKWFWNNVNTSALESIRSAYDATKRCVFFAIPTGTNSLPDTLLTYNTLAGRWTKAAIPCEAIWTADNGLDGTPGTQEILGVMDQTHTPNYLIGSPLTGYMEGCDLYFSDGTRRLITGVRPMVNSTDLPLITIGRRNSLQDTVTYDQGYFPDRFSRIAPALSSGFYTRVRTQSGNATSLHGATLYFESQGRV